MGGEAITFDPLNNVPINDFGTDSDQCFALEKHRIHPDGSWIARDYDSQGRKTVELRPWLNAPEEPPSDVSASAAQGDAVHYSYEPLVSEDILVFNDQRPRTTTRNVLGQIVERTWNVYGAETNGAK